MPAERKRKVLSPLRQGTSQGTSSEAKESFKEKSAGNRRRRFAGGGRGGISVVEVFSWGEPARIQREAAKRYELCMEIHQQVDEIIAPYLEGEESFEYDEEILTQAAEDVYAYAQTLEEQGTIEGSAMCREGFSVSFFLRDGSTSVYLPPINDYYAGGEDQDLRIGVVDMLSLAETDRTGGI